VNDHCVGCDRDSHVASWLHRTCHGSSTLTQDSAHSRRVTSVITYK
jgi:hypothetical protein